MIKQLAAIANELDSRGLAKEADAVDNILKKASSSDDLFEDLWHDFGEPVDLSKKDEGSEDEEYVTVTASNGEDIKLHKNMSGLDTGFAVIANPYFMFPEGHPNHDPNWRFKDGDTVIGVEEDTFGAMPVADAYQAFHWAMEQEKEFMDQAFDAQYDEDEDEGKDYVKKEYEREADFMGLTGEERAMYINRETHPWVHPHSDRRGPLEFEAYPDHLPMFEGMGRRHSTKHSK